MTFNRCMQTVCHNVNSLTTQLLFKLNSEQDISLEQVRQNQINSLMSQFQEPNHLAGRLQPKVNPNGITTSKCAKTKLDAECLSVFRNLIKSRFSVDVESANEDDLSDSSDASQSEEQEGNNSEPEEVEQP